MISDFFAYVLIPAYTIFFSSGADLFTTNFSVIGNSENLRYTFSLWGILTGGFFYYQTRNIILLSRGNALEYHLLNTALVLLLTSVVTPYLPQELPFPSFLHVIFAFCSSVILLLCLLLIIKRLHHQMPEQFASFLYGLLLIICICILLLLLAGIVSSALEIFCTLSLCVLVRRLVRRLKTIHKQSAP